MLRTWLSAVFATASSAIFILTVSCRDGQIHGDIVLCSILHPIQYFMVVFSLIVALVLLKEKAWF